MYVRIIQGIVSVAIVAVSVLSQLWPGFAADALSQMARPSVTLQDLRLARVAFADNDDNSDDNDNEDDGDNEDDDNDDNDDDKDNGDKDNDDDDNDDEDNDDDNSDGDNGDEDAALDNGSPPAPATAPAPPARQPAATTGSETEATGTSTGGDSTIALAGERIVVQLFPWMPPGVIITVRLADPATTPPPGTRVDALVFRLEAQDAAGAPLAALPAEVHLAARYANADVTGLDKQRITLSWLDPADNQWKPAAKLAADPANNYVAASVTALGLYAVSAP